VTPFAREVQRMRPLPLVSVSERLYFSTTHGSC
jgi:hypothetical protein